MLGPAHSMQLSSAQSDSKAVLGPCRPDQTAHVQRFVYAYATYFSLRLGHTYGHAKCSLGLQVYPHQGRLQLGLHQQAAMYSRHMTVSLLAAQRSAAR